MSDIRVFLSFDVDHDQDLAELLREQSQRGGSNFRVIDGSEGGEVTDRWRAAARRRIGETDQVVVICGLHTGDSPRVAAEVEIAKEEDTPCLFLWGRREQMCSLPTSASRSASMYSWTWDIVVQRITETLRSKQMLEVPDQFKRP